MDNNDIVTAMEKRITKLEKKHRFYTRSSNLLSMINIILSSSIPIIIDVAEKEVTLLLVVSIFSALITLIQTFKSTFHLSDKIQDTSMAIAYLSKEKLLFQTRTEPYTGSDEENMHQLIKGLAGEADQLLDDLRNAN